MVERSKRCYQCLGVGHKAAECTRARKCGVSGYNSTQHNRLLHRDPPDAVLQNSGSSQEVPETEQTTRSFVNGRTDNVSLMVLPAVVRKGSRQLKVNVMLDPCSTGSCRSKYGNRIAFMKLSNHFYFQSLLYIMCQILIIMCQILIMIVFSLSIMLILNNSFLERLKGGRGRENKTVLSYIKMYGGPEVRWLTRDTSQNNEIHD